MAGTTRIEELQKKFDENPRRYFAPLANEFRKAGDTDQAIAICEEYLPQQPGHMSGHIVYGQALFEAGRLEDSRTVFETALTLDPENLIALRHLGDIARAGGDPAAARGWYQRVLEADPRNEEIGALIAELDENPAVSSTAPTPISTPTVQGAAVPSEESDESAFTLSDVPTVEVPQMGGMAAPAAEQPVEFPLETAPTESPLPDIERTAEQAVEHMPRHTAQPMPEPLDLPLELPTDIFGDLTETTTPPKSETPPGEFRLSMAIESAAGVEPHEPDASIHDTPTVDGLIPAKFEDPGALAGLEPTSFDERASAEVPAGAEAMGVTSAYDVDAPAAEPPAGHDEAAASTTELPFITDEFGEEPPAEPEGTLARPFVTETMAELYLRQGHHEEAIAVYRQLISQRPDDAALRARLAEVERGPRAGMRGPSIRDFLGAFAARRPMGWDEDGGDEYGAGQANGREAARPEPPMGTPRASAPVVGRPTGGSIDALFPSTPAREDEAAAQRLARAFAGDEIGARDEEALAGAPARKATTELSLDHVFRERGATPSQGQPSFSFDQFFAQGAAAHDESVAADQGGAAPAAPDDDIQQFNAWLEGLKKS